MMFLYLLLWNNRFLLDRPCVSTALLWSFSVAISQTAAMTYRPENCIIHRDPHGANSDSLAVPLNFPPVSAKDGHPLFLSRSKGADGFANEMRLLLEEIGGRILLHILEVLRGGLWVALWYEYKYGLVQLFA